MVLLTLLFVKGMRVRPEVPFSPHGHLVDQTLFFKPFLETSSNTVSRGLFFSRGLAVAPIDASLLTESSFCPNRFFVYPHKTSAQPSLVNLSRRLKISHCNSSVFLLKTVLAILGPLYLHVNFRVLLSISTNKPAES